MAKINIEKLPSGSYRIRKTYNGKTYKKTLPYKPTQKEALKIVAEMLDADSSVIKADFKRAAELY